ncbi:uncharacterized protein LOC124133238 [Haliotis rufescens]|uniref:uncharacterized protein LOC124133238 n=1 Tax=Haliotis rufescens TaxID=6454 RepID=UPI00201F5D54|nr:uncharacterized protein LOC124133238 [Haliotis rufescens]
MDKITCPYCNGKYTSLAKHKKCQKRDDALSSAKPKASSVKQKINDVKEEECQDSKETCPYCNGKYTSLAKHKKCQKRDDALSSAKPKASSVKQKINDVKEEECQDSKETCPYCNGKYTSLAKHKKCQKRDDALSSAKPKASSVKQKINDVKEEECQDSKETCPYCNGKYTSLAKHKKCQKRDDALSSAKPKASSVKQKINDIKKEECQDSEKYQRRDEVSLREETHVVLSCYDKSKRQTEMHIKSKKTYNGQKPALSPTDKEELDKFANGIFENKIIMISNTRNISDFFGTEVQLRKHQMKTAREMFNPLVCKVISHLQTKTTWVWEDLKSGSYYDGTKVSRPDEMDCMFVAQLKGLDVSTHGAPAGFCYVKVTQSQTDLSSLCNKGFLSSTKFRQYVFSCLADMELRRVKRDTTLGPGSPSYGITYDTGLKTGDSKFLISIDLVPALHFPGWPITARDFSSCSDGRLKDISKKGFHVVAKACDRADAKDRDLLWRLSFSASEKTITKHADMGEKGEEKKDGCAGNSESKAERTCKKKVLRILKMILEIAKDDQDRCKIDESLATGGKEIASKLRLAVKYTREHGYRVDKHKFTTFQLRTLMWNEFYVTTLEGVWGNDSLVNRLKLCISKLKKMLTGELPMEHFFIPNFDIMAEVPLVERKYLFIMACVAEKLL